MKMTLIQALLFIVGAPLVGGLLTGFDRILTARMQGRVGPPIFQPFYDVLKLFKKERLVVAQVQNFYLFFFLLLVVVTGVIFFTGGDLLLVIFALTLGNVFLILAAYAANSPYSHIGAQRELIQMMAYEPMIIIMALGMYMVTKSFNVIDIATSSLPLILYLPGIFAGFLYILTIKLRKSPFDLSMSHHAHQELVKGITTEFSGKGLAMVEIAHWYENMFLLGMVFLFFGFNPILGALVVLGTYIFEIFIDNTSARFKWQLVLKSSWVVTLVLGLANIIVLSVVLNYKLW